MKRAKVISLRSFVLVTAVCGVLFAVGRLPPISAAIAIAATFVLASGCVVLSLCFHCEAFARGLLRRSTIVLTGICLYLISLGPACWFMTSSLTTELRDQQISRGFYHIYAPAGVCFAHLPEPLKSVGVSFLQLWTSDRAIIDYGWGVGIIIDGNLGVIGT